MDRDAFFEFLPEIAETGAEGQTIRLPTGLASDCLTPQARRGAP